jgi:hypothetical protein
MEREHDREVQERHEVIFTTLPEEGLMRNTFVAQGERAEMPWLTYWRGLERHGGRRERRTAQRVSQMKIFRMFHWESEAVEKVLAYIATGSWSGKKPSGLLGPDGEPI